MIEVRPTGPRRRFAALVGAGAVMAVVAAGLVVPSGATAVILPGAVGSDLLGDPQGPDDFDARTGSVTPTASQLQIVGALGASVQWNRFGTPASLIKYGGYLASGLTGSDADAARNWLRSKAALFRLSTTDVNNLELVSDSVMAGGAGHAIMFRQRFGSLPATQDGLITVGIRGGKVAYVSSSAAGNQGAPAAAILTAQQAWLRAAADIGRTVSAGAIGSARQQNGWTVFPVSGFSTPAIGLAKPVRRVDQRARLVALPTYTQGVKAAYEVDVLDNTAGRPVVGYVTFVDARSGAILFRHNAVDELATGLPMAADSGFFSGRTGTNTSKPLCGPRHPIQVQVPIDKRIDVVATADVPADDIVIDLYRPNDTLAAHADTLFSPEAVNYTLTPSDPSGTWYALVCEFEEVPNFSYRGFFVVSPVATPPAFAFPPQWNMFTANPALPPGDISPPFNYPGTDNRTNACWTTQDPGAPPGCGLDLTPNVGDTNLASRVPWDHNVQTNLPNFQTDGNNAFTAEGWSTDLVPGPASQRPVDLDRTYGFQEVGDPGSATGALEGWTNQWNKSKCSPTSFTPATNNNDVLAATTSLHAGHNRFHDYSYHLGFTERNFNMQVNNFGTTAPGPFPFGRELDPEIGDVQNGALLPAALGLTRDNANQITLQDGIPGITNQYLFQPIAGAFYAPCADGDLDTSIYGHEYTHAISNRMVAGPDSGLSGYQAGSMGESWSDLVAVEYLNAYKYAPTSTGENPFAVGIYATGNKKKAIRDYAINDNPLNYSDLGFDLTGPEVHADGEVWNAANYEIRQALIQKYNGAFPASNLGLQKRCADGNLPADQCPGNRRWIQLMFDAFLLQQSNTSMLTARDAYLAADVMRFGGANQAQLWNAFAKRGMGEGAVTNGNTDTEPKPDFTSPFATEATLQFKATDMTASGQPAQAGKLYVGRYEARVTPIATTNPAVSGGAVTVKLVPGTYDFLFQANGYGLRRFTLTFTAGQVVSRVLHLSPNLASKFKGATATSSTGGVNADQLIDDTEATNWAALSQAAGVQTTNPSVTVKLAGTGTQTVRSVQVSAMLRPADTTQGQQDPGGQNRFTALRKFAIETCVASTANANCSAPTSFTRIFTSSDDAFPAVAPRPVAPDLLIRPFDVPDTGATHVRLVALQNQCTGTADYRGEQDNDPANNTDCVTASIQDTKVRAAELEVYAFDADDRPPGDPVVLTTMVAPVTARAGSTFTYDITYLNLGPAPSSAAGITDVLPKSLSFVSATDGGTYNATTRKVVWPLGTVGVNASGTVHLTTKAVGPVGTIVLNQAQFTGKMTFAPPAAAITAIVP